MKCFYRFYTVLVIPLVFMIGACHKNKEESIGAINEEEIVIPSTINVSLESDVESLDLDSTNAEVSKVLELSWNLEKSVAGLKVNYVLQFDSLNGNFTYPVNLSMGIDSAKDVTAKDLNDLALRLGLTSEEEGKLPVRIKATIKRANSPLYVDSTLYSNVITLTVNPYSTGIDNTKFPAPDSLFIVGDATPAGNWDIPVPIPGQNFTDLGDSTFGIIIPLKANHHYAFLSKNRTENEKYSLQEENSGSDNSGEFVIKGKKDIPSPPKDGLYKIIVAFDFHTYSVTAVDPSSIPDSIVIGGPFGNSHSGWTLPSPSDLDQRFQKTSAYTFELTIKTHTWDGSGALFSEYPHWSSRIGPLDNDSVYEGTFQCCSSSYDSFNMPSDGKTYNFELNYLTHTYKLTQL